MSPYGLTQFARQTYRNIETDRETGTPVATPVWFGEDLSTFYSDSRAQPGKVKRRRNNPKVRLVPCDIRGNPLRFSPQQRQRQIRRWRHVSSPGTKEDRLMTYCLS
jgi:PPOX class probable F420-dependent enzyme